MRRLVLALLVLAAACKSTTPPAAPLPVPPPVAEARPYGLTLDEEALILRLEDRREYDKSVAAAWIHHENPLHRARMALALGRIGAATFDDAGLPDGFFRAAGEIYESLAGYKDTPGMPSVAEVAKALAGRPRG